MARHHKIFTVPDGRGIASFHELIRRKYHITLRSCLLAFCFDTTTLIEIAVHTLIITAGRRDINAGTFTEPFAIEFITVLGITYTTKHCIRVLCFIFLQSVSSPTWQVSTG